MRSRWIATALGLALLAFTVDGALAGKRKPAARQLSVVPLSATSPITNTGALKICVAGFAEGDYVKVSIPWIGRPTSHTNLTYEHLADAAGGFCFASPPDWTEIDLQDGTYSIETQWGKSGTGGIHRGPSTTFTVMAN